MAPQIQPGTPAPRPLYVRQLNAQGKTVNTYVFLGSQSDTFTPPKDPISDTLQTGIPTICSEYIHWDDTIEQIRNKIIRQIVAKEERTVQPHEMYLFGYIRENTDTLAIYQSITKQRESIDIPISRAQMHQLLLNMGVDVPVDSLRQSYTYEQILSYKTNGGAYPFSKDEFTLPVPLGRELYDRHGKLVRDYVFAANPSKRVQQLYDIGSNVWVDRSLNTVLMSYSTLVGDTLYLCLADTVSSIGMGNYFPVAPPSAAQREYSALENTVDFLYELKYSGVLAEPAPATVHEFTTIIRYPYNIVLPLDTIFGQLHATVQIPFIQYNPGKQRDSVIRLRSIYKTFQGEPVPTLDPILLEKVIEDLSKKHETISMYLPSDSKSTVPIALYVILGKTGDVYFKIVATDKQKWIPSNTIEEFIVNTCNPILDILNDSVQPLGFTYDELKSPLPTNIIVSDIKYTSVYEPLVKTSAIEPGKFVNVFQNLFDRKQVGGSSQIQNEDVFFFTRSGGENTRQALLEFHLHQCDDNAALQSTLLKKYAVNVDRLKRRKILIKPITLTVKREQRGSFSWTVSNITSLMMLSTIHSYVNALHRCFKGEILETNSIFTKYLPVLEAKNLVWTVDAVDTADIIQIRENIHDSEFVDEAEEEDMESLMGDEVEDEEEEVLLEFQNIEEDEDNEYFTGGGDKANPHQKENDEKNRQAYEKLQLEYPSKKGVQMKNANGVFNSRRKRLDHDLFYTTDESAKFTTTCQASAERQPVPLTDEEYEQNKDNFTDLMHLQYGTTDQKMHYVCPPHYCLPKNMPMTDEDVAAGKCMGLKDENGNVMPDKTFSDNFLPRDAFVYSFKKRTEQKGFYPGLIWDDSVDPDHKDVKNSSVCCFTMKRAEKKGVEAARAAKTVKSPAASAAVAAPAAMNKYNPNKDLAKMNTGDFAQLPPEVQSFLQMYEFVAQNVFDDIGDNALATVAVKPQLLRFRVENGSFLACIAEAASFLQSDTKPVPTMPLKQFIQTLTDKLSLDDFLQYQNGALAALFRPKKRYEVDVNAYRKTEFYKSFVDKSGELDVIHEDFMEETIQSFEEFKEYMRENPNMDHTYLWDLAIRNPMYPAKQSINIVILDVKHDSITNKVDIVCPTNSRYATYRKDYLTLILLRMGENQYEPIYQMEKTAKSPPKLMKLFDYDSYNKYIRRLLFIVAQISQNLCRPVQTTKVKQALSAMEVYKKLQKTDDFNDVVGQIQNYHKQVIGFLVKILVEKDTVEEHTIFVPCFPSVAIHTGSIPIIRMDADITNDRKMWTDYKTTVDTLRKIAEDTGIPCTPQIINVYRDDIGDFVVGVHTETNQFVKVSPPLPETELGDIPVDMTVKYAVVKTASKEADYLATDVALALSANKKDSERLALIQEKIIDRDYFALFRKLVRDKFSASESKRAEINTIISSKLTATYPENLQKIRDILVELCDDTISFQETAEEIWAECAANPNSSRCKVMVIDNKIIVPTRKGESKSTRDRYYTRIADELLRYGHMRQIMLLPQTRLVPREEDVRFTAGPDEMITSASQLKTQTEARIEFYNKTGITLGNVKQIDLDHALPQGVANPENAFVRDINLAQQHKIVLDKTPVKAAVSVSELAKELIEKCSIYGTYRAEPISGNTETSFWKNKFPMDTLEITSQNKNTVLTLILYDYPKIQRLINLEGIKSSNFLEEESKKLGLLDEFKQKYLIKPPKQAETLTEFDLYLFAQLYKVPLCLFSSRGFQSNLPEVSKEKLICLYRDPDVSEEPKYYFLRTLSDNIVSDKKGKNYLNLLYPAQPIPAGVDVIYLD